MGSIVGLFLLLLLLVGDVGFAVWWRCALADSGCQRGTHCCCYEARTLTTAAAAVGVCQVGDPVFGPTRVRSHSILLYVQALEPVLEIFTIFSHSLSLLRRKCHSQSYGDGLVSVERWIRCLSLVLMIKLRLDNFRRVL